MKGALHRGIAAKKDFHLRVNEHFKFSAGYRKLR